MGSPSISSATDALLPSRLARLNQIMRSARIEKTARIMGVTILATKLVDDPGLDLGTLRLSDGVVITTTVDVVADAFA